MSELHQLLDKFEREVDRFAAVAEKIDTDEPDATRIDIALGVAKRVRRTSNLVVRELARLRDQSQPEGGTD